MKNSFLFLAFLIVSFNACKKADLTIGGTGHVYGQTYWQNNLLSKSNPLAFLQNRNIYIDELPSDSSNFIYHVRTDTLGSFIFAGLKNNTKYLVFFKDTIQGNTYSFYREVVATNSPYEFKASIAPEDASGVLFHVSDNENAPIFGAEVNLFRSRILAESKDPSGSVYRINSDQYGQAMKTGLPEGQWFALATFKSESLELSAITPFNVEKFKTISIPIVLQE